MEQRGGVNRGVNPLLDLAADILLLCIQDMKRGKKEIYVVTAEEHLKSPIGRLTLDVCLPDEYNPEQALRKLGVL